MSGTCDWIMEQDSMNMECFEPLAHFDVHAGKQSVVLGMAF